MIGHDEGDTVEFMARTAHAPNRLVARQQVLSGDSANGEDYFRLNELDLAVQVRSAGGGLVGFGIAIIGGLHFRILAMKTSSRRCPIARSISSSSFPALPTNGSPRLSSSAPGASPTISQSAFGLPTPKTVFVLPAARPHRVQALTAPRRASQSSASTATSPTETPSSAPPSTGPGPSAASRGNQTSIPIARK